MLQGIVHDAGIIGARSAYTKFVNNWGQPIASVLFDEQAHEIHAGGWWRSPCSDPVQAPKRARTHPVESLEPGDVLVANDPFRGGIHPTDVSVYTPIFHDGEVAYFHGTLMIVSDLGGMSSSGLPANATEVFHEGLVIPAIKLMRRGEPVPEVKTLIQANSRAPMAVWGDLMALVGSGVFASRRMIELIEKYGKATIDAVVQEMFAYSARLVRATFAAIPDGVYHGSYSTEPLDELDTPHPIEVTITIDGDRCCMDFSGTGPSARGPINASYACALSMCMATVSCLAGTEIPWNEGAYNALEVILPYGTMVNSGYPLPTNARLATTGAMRDAIFQALAPVFPRVAVAPSGVISTVSASGASAEKEFWCMLDPQWGSGGARAGVDGVDGSTWPLGIGAGYPRSMEHFETEYPVRFDRLGLLADSGGPGRWRGGCGTVKDMEFLADADVTVRAMDRHTHPPRGVEGGNDGRRGLWLLNPGRPDERELPAKQTNVRVRAGDRLWRESAGAGGYGDPYTRPPELVAADVERGVVSIIGAREGYSVVIRPDGTLDHQGTTELRAEHAPQHAPKGSNA